MIKVDAITKCWIWQGKPTKLGYGQVHRKGITKPAHRYVYEQIKGPIPNNNHLHHICKNLMCVNPDHLKPITPTEHAKLHDLGKNRKTPICSTCGKDWFICDALRQSGISTH